MRASVVFCAVAASVVSAASITDYPTCALTCLTSADYGSCSFTDQACLCQSQDFINSSTTCIRSSCSAADDAKAGEISNELCAAAGVQVTFTTSGVATSTSAASTSSTGTGSTKSTTNAASSIISGAQATITSILSAASTAAASASANAHTTTTKSGAEAVGVAKGAVVLAGLLGGVAMLL